MSISIPQDGMTDLIEINEFPTELKLALKGLNNENRQKILLLGAYRHSNPTSDEDHQKCKDYLINVKHYLIYNGFLDTKLVEDFDDEFSSLPKTASPIHFKGKSFHYIDNWADILLFILTSECDISGVLREFSHIVESNQEKCNISCILCHKKIKLSMLTQADIKENRLLENRFNNQKQLNEFAFSASFNLLYESVLRAEK
ncbi:hypothetical protein ES703_09724 [subsurface metagenome]